MDWKESLSMAYSTNPQAVEEYHREEEVETLAPSQQQLRVSIEKKGRGGKTATLISHFVGSEHDLKELARQLKTKCGVGGSARDDQILIQGEMKEKVVQLLRAMGYMQTK